MQVIVAEPHRVLRQSQPRICGCRFLSDAKISPGDQRISTENVKLLIELNVRACRMSYPPASDWSINNRIEWRMEWQHTGAIKSILPKQVDREFKGVAIDFGGKRVRFWSRGFVCRTKKVLACGHSPVRDSTMADSVSSKR